MAASSIFSASRPSSFVDSRAMRSRPSSSNWLNPRVRVRLFARFTARTFEDRSLFDILRKHYQIEVKGGEQKIQAITADERLIEHFGVRKNHPILRMDRKLDTNRPDFSFYSQIYCNTENYSLIGRF